MVRLIDDQQVEARRARLFGAVLVIGEEAGGTEDELGFGERVHVVLHRDQAVVDAVRCLAAAFVVDREEHVEAPKQLHEPLVDQRLGDEDEDAVGAARQVQAVENEAGFDGFPEANFVGEKDAGMEAVRCLGDDGKLVRDEVDACPGVAAGGGAAYLRVPAEGIEALVEIEGMVGQPGEQAFLRADEGKRIQQVAFVDGFPLAVVGEEIVFLGDLLDGEMVLRVVGNLIARREADADQRRGADGVGAGVLGGGEADFHQSVFLGNDMAEAEGGFGGGDVALAGDHEILKFKL